MKQYRYLLFDLDGTLTYSHPGIFGCIRYALEEMGREIPGEETLRKAVGPSLMWSFQHLCGMTEEDATEATRLYRVRYAKIGWRENEPIDGALSALSALKERGFVLALATSKPLVFAKQISELFGFSKYLSVEVGSGIGGEFPTKASVIEEVVRQLRADKKDCLMIGDRLHDVEGAREAGVDVAALDVGYAEEGEFQAYPPDYYFPSFEAFLAKILGE